MNYREIRDHVIALDQLLTGRSHKECSKMYDDQINNEEDILWTEEYYLSDGGISRLIINAHERSIAITYHSSTDVKKAFMRSVTMTLKKAIIEGILCRMQILAEVHGLLEKCEE